MTPEQDHIFATAVSAIASSLGRPVLYGPDNRPLVPAPIVYSKAGARRTGDLQNWNPRRLLNQDMVTRERETLVERSLDLTGSDPHAAGLVSTFATTVIGSGLVPVPALDPDILDMPPDQIRVGEWGHRQF